MKTAEILNVLQFGELDVDGLLPWSSNYTFLVRICRESIELDAVYKPRRGERPLWDFAKGSLLLRERAAFLISDALGWDLIPPTVLRQGPNGIGSVQLFVEHDPERHYFTFEGELAYQRELQKIVLLDVIINNADRKAGHVLLQEKSPENETDRLWAIDHGISFHAEYKLRTVIWEFAGMPIPELLLQDLSQLKQKLNTNDLFLNQLGELLSEEEIKAMKHRLSTMKAQAKFRVPGPGRHYPWPPV
ncbi:MAG: SCO1664 family protein [Chloroflexi bacterium]|nr:SCO1664 family protein [Chloroflexota bacterium]